MTRHYIAVPYDHTVIHLPLLHFLTHTIHVYNRLIATGHANLVQQAIKGFPPTPDTSNMKGPIPCKTEVKTENRNRPFLSPKHQPQQDLHREDQRPPPSPESIRRLPANKRDPHRKDQRLPPSSESVRRPPANKRVFFLQEAASLREAARLRNVKLLGTNPADI